MNRQARGQRPWGEVLFRRRPRSRRSSNEVAPSAGGGGGARDRRSRFSSCSPVRRGVGGGRHREISAELRSENIFRICRDSQSRRPLRCRWALQPGFCTASKGWAQGRMVVHSWGGKLNDCDLWSPSSVWGRGCPVRVPLGTARRALRAIQLFCTRQNRMNRPGARSKTVGQRRFSDRARELGAGRATATRRVARASRRPTAGPGAARHPKAGFFFAKPAGVGPQEGLAKFGQFRRGLAKGA